jgi:hypothetical protein
VVLVLTETQSILVKPYITGFIGTSRDMWPGWKTPLMIDVNPSAA